MATKMMKICEGKPNKQGNEMKGLNNKNFKIDHLELEASLGYTVTTRMPWVTE